jgi:hypothetical protein
MLIQETNRGSNAAETIPDMLMISRYLPDGIIKNLLRSITIISVEKIPVTNAAIHTVRFSTRSLNDR